VNLLGCALLGGVDKVDRRGRKVNQTSSEDLRKYYELDGRCHWVVVPVRVKYWSKCMSEKT